MMDGLKNWLDGLQVDWMRHARWASLASLAFVVLSWILMVVPGPNWGIDFTGGTEIQVRFEEPLAIGELRDALASIDVPSDAIQEIGTDGRSFKVRIRDASFGAEAVRDGVVDALTEAFGPAWIDTVAFSAEVGARVNVKYTGDRVMIDRVQAAVDGIDGAQAAEGREDNEVVIKLPGLASQVSREIGSALGDRAFEVQSVDAVGPKVGDSLKQQGVLSVLATLALVLLYIAFRFDIAYAPGAILALIHDVSVTLGIFVLIQHELSLPMIGALLTIVGYSLNDTIVIFDRVRENRERFRREDLVDLINTSINETLSRTLATSGTTLFAVSAFLVFGNAVIADFVLALFFGIVFGTYSTIFVATPMIVVMERVRPQLVALMAIDLPEPEEDGGEAIPDQFLTESEKRRRERQRLKDEADDEPVPE